MTIRFNRSLFIHIPRTGGGWFRNVVKELPIKSHILIGDLDSHVPLKVLPENWQQLSSFSFVRHPYVWLKSRWSHAIEFNTYGEQTFFEVHRVFDECVRPTFRETVETIIARRPGIVGLTYETMLKGVQHLRRTEDLPLAAYELLHEFEGLPEEYQTQIVSRPPFNSTATLHHYQEQLDSLPDTLVQEFMCTEYAAMALWKGAGKWRE